MKHSAQYRNLKWTAFFLTVVLLLISFAAVYFHSNKQPTETPQKNSNPLVESLGGSLSNEAFAALIEENLSELAFIEEITFNGTEEGRFVVTGTFSNPTRLIAICRELEPFEMILNSLKGSRISITGHLGADENGNGRFISDTIACSGFTLPGGIATDYIEEYTGLNDLFEVPIEEISITEQGISFDADLPAVIQTALYK